jgi:hypothetical protein
MIMQRFARSSVFSVGDLGTVDQTMTTSPRHAVGARGWPISGTIASLGEDEIG